MKKYHETRIFSLEYLRAIGCVLVVVGHLFIVGCLLPKTVMSWLPFITDAPYPIAGDGNPYAAVLINFSRQFGINIGHLGVAIFFLLSGFVILRSLDHESIGSFVVRRLFRILPCCAVAVAATLVFVAAVCGAHGVSTPLTIGDGLASATISMNYVHHLPVMPVLWSLEVEVTFYTLMTILASASRRVTTRMLLVIALVLSNLVFLLVGLSRDLSISPELATQLVHLSQILLYMPLILIGAVVYREWSDGWQWGSLCRVAAGVSIFFAAYLSYGPIAGWDALGVDAGSVVLALGLFAAAVAWRRERRWLAPLRFIGEISYPLYLVHAPLGWAVLDGMARCGFSVHAGCAAALAASVAAAWVLHTWVERPIQRLGIALSTRLRRRTVALPGLPAAPATA